MSISVFCASLILHVPAETWGHINRIRQMTLISAPHGICYRGVGGITVSRTLAGLRRSAGLKVLFFSRDGERVEQLALALRLRWPDLNPLIVSQGGVGIQAVEQEEPDLVMLCEELPDMSLWLATREIRKLSDIPLILTVESDNDMDVVRALELGADDYINSVSRIVGQTRFQMASAKNDRPMNRVQMHPGKG